MFRRLFARTFSTTKGQVRVLHYAPLSGISVGDCVAQRAFVLFIAAHGRYKCVPPMSLERKNRRPSIARADRRERTRFRELALRAPDCDETADAFVFAYRSLERPDRIRMARAVGRDLRGAGHDPRPALAILFAAEEDPQLTAELIDLLGVFDPPGSDSLALASFYGSEPIVGTLIGIPNAEGEGWLGLFAGQGDEHAEAPPEIALLHAPSFYQLEECVREKLGRQPRRVPIELAAGELAPQILRYRRTRGSLPPEARQFAGLFSI